jgi:natural product precursor
MTGEQKVERLKTLINEVRELSAELSEDELAQVAGGSNLLCGCGSGGIGRDNSDFDERNKMAWL